MARRLHRHHAVEGGGEEAIALEALANDHGVVPFGDWDEHGLHEGVKFLLRTRRLLKRSPRVHAAHATVPKVIVHPRQTFTEEQLDAVLLAGHQPGLPVGQEDYLFLGT
eukprot:scaffold50915_cov66-Phaeocystis_antarctica.AAC.6